MGCIDRIARRALPVAMALGTFAWSLPSAIAAPTDGTATTESKPKPRANKPSAKDGKQAGVASFYSKRLAGRKTSSGERYDPAALTAAHRDLPMGTQVKVTNPKTDKSVVVTVNDRGPVPKGRNIDLSNAAASELGMTKAGVAKVETEVVGKRDDAAPK